MSTIQTSSWHSSRTAICNPCLANRTTTASTNPAIRSLDTAILQRKITRPIGTAPLISSLTFLTVTFTKLEKAIWTQNRHPRAPAAPVAQTRFPPSTPGATFWAGFRAMSTIQTSPWHSSRTAICNHCLANHTTTASSTFLLSTFLFTSGLCRISAHSHPYSLHLQSLHIPNLMYLWLCIVVIIYGCDYLLLCLFIVAVMYCICDFLLLWLFAHGYLLCCDYFLL